MEHFGAYLKAQREKKGIRLEEIASITKIHLHSLELLENSRWGQLPPEPFIRGFIIAYAKYVGLDPKETIGKYLDEVAPGSALKAAAEGTIPVSAPAEPAQTAHPPTESNAHRPTATEVIEHAQPISSRKVALVAAGIFVFVVTISIIYIGKRASEPQVAETTDAATKTAASPASHPPAPAASETQQASPQVAEPRNVASPSPERNTNSLPPPSAQPADYKHEIVIEGRERTWVKVVVDEEPPIEYFLPQGEKAKYDAKDKIKVVLGNATGSKVSHNGEVATGKQYSGTIRSYVFPQGSKFPQDLPPKRAPAPAPKEDADSSDTTAIE
jgi:cytoskeleton protein RodZ